MSALIIFCKAHGHPWVCHGAIPPQCPDCPPEAPTTWTRQPPYDDPKTAYHNSTSDKKFLHSLDIPTDD